jgi:L-ascorbate metabolism protein UlaG (beta-lactamase superfamily)
MKLLRPARIREYFKSLSILKKVLLSLLLGLFITLSILIINSKQPLYHGPVSDHFDGLHFFQEGSDHSFGKMVKWLWEMETVDWPEWINDPPQPKSPERVNNGELRVTYINHATLLIQVDGVNVLTDPIWSMRAGPFSRLGPKRVRAPGIAMKDLPQIDIILISHDHYDHLDLATLEQLARRDRPVVLAGLGVKTLLTSLNFSEVHEMDWWQEFDFKENRMKFTFVPAVHNSGRGMLGGNRTLWGGFVIEGKSGRVYFAGDTGYGSFLGSIKKRFGGFRLAVFPIGSYEKRWFMKNQHMNPDDAVKAHRLLGVKQSVGMHFGTFAEHPEQAVDAHERDLSAALKKYGVNESAFWVLGFGEGIRVPEVAE